MSRFSHVARAAALAATLAVIGGVGAAQVATAHTAQGVRATTCAAVGTYQVGPRVVALHPRPVPPASHPSARTSAVVVAIGVMRGTLSIASYSGCGTAGTNTSGSFSVRRTPIGPPMLRKGIGGQRAIACPESAIPGCVWPVTGVISATGSFRSDPAHAGDAFYVLVSGSVTSARPGPQLGVPCSQKAGCPGGSVITSTATFHDVTGYLQVQPGQSATLVFLPPPAPGGALSGVTPMSLYGWRGTASSPPVTPKPPIR